jgi:hypothetical protein
VFFLGSSCAAWYTLILTGSALFDELVFSSTVIIASCGSWGL